MILRNLAILLIIIITSCSVKEDYVDGDRIQGLYRRDYYDKIEYICIKNDLTYEYFTEDSIVNKGTWDYTWSNGVSMIGLNDFNYNMVLKKNSNYSSYTMPIKYSHMKNAVLLRMNPDDYFMDFVRIDSTSCNIK